jgi:hypothetical protein
MARNLTPAQWEALGKLVNHKAGSFDIRYLKDEEMAFMDTCLSLGNFGYVGARSTGPGDSITIISVLPAGEAAWKAHQAASDE